MILRDAGRVAEGDCGTRIAERRKATDLNARQPGAPVSIEGRRISGDYKRTPRAQRRAGGERARPLSGRGAAELPTGQVDGIRTRVVNFHPLPIEGRNRSRVLIGPGGVVHDFGDDNRGANCGGQRQKRKDYQQLARQKQHEMQTLAGP